MNTQLELEKKRINKIIKESKDKQKVIDTWMSEPGWIYINNKKTNK
jgi:hypothetical protein